MLNDLLFYLLDLGVLGEWHFGCLHCTYLLPLVQAISTQMPLLVASETVPFAALLLLLRVDLHGLSLATVCRSLPGHPSSPQVTASALTSRFACRGTCHATCSVFVTTGGGKLLLVPRLLVVACLDVVCLVVGVIALPFLIHDKDMLLPLVVIGGNPNSDIGDDGGITRRNPPLYGGDHLPPRVHVVSSPS